MCNLIETLIILKKKIENSKLIKKIGIIIKKIVIFSKLSKYIYIYI